MDVLLEVPSATDREPMARDLAFLARFYFDRYLDTWTPPVARCERLDALYPEPLVRLLRPALPLGEAKLADRRVRALLQQESKP